MLLFNFLNYTVQRRRSQHARTLTPMNTSEGLSTDRSADSPSHQWRLVVDGNVAYHLTHTSENPGLNPGKDASTKIWTLVGNVPLNRPTIGLQAYLQFFY
jgi:hypothetical protein